MKISIVDDSELVVEKVSARLSNIEVYKVMGKSQKARREGSERVSERCQYNASRII